MADIRLVQPIRIVDLDTNNEVDVSAAGNLGTEIRIALPAGTNNIGDVDVLSVTPGVGATDLGKAEDAVHASGDVGVMALAVRKDTAAGLGADGDYVALQTDANGRLHVITTQAGAVDTELPAAGALADNTANPTTTSVGTFPHVFDGSTWDRAPGTSADGLLVNLGANNDVDTELPAAAALADATANPTAPAVGAHLMGWNGSTWDRVDTANTGRLQVDVVTGGGTDTPTNPVASVQTSSAVAAGSSATLDTSDIPTKKGWGVDLTASVPFKAVLSIVANGVATTVAVLFGGAGQLLQWRPPNRNFFTVGGATAGQDGLRAVMTNLDPSEAADVYATFYYADN